MKEKCGQQKDVKNEEQGKANAAMESRLATATATAIALGACYPLQSTIIQVLIEGLRWDHISKIHVSIQESSDQRSKF